MNAPIIWIGLPILASLMFWIFRKREQPGLIVGLVVSFFLFITAIITPVGKPLLKIGSFTIQISPAIEILGRNFTLTNGDLILAALVFFLLFLFLTMSFIIEIPSNFVSIGFLLTGIIIAALSVQPFLYAALLLEVAVLLSILLLSKGGETPTTGVIRFLIFQSMAMPIMLSAGWVLSAVEANPSEPTLIFQALGLIGLGFAFWLAVFPFNFWMPQLAGEKSPLLVGFVLTLFNTATLILIMRFLDGFVWLRDDSRIFILLRYLGILMLGSGALLFLIEINRRKSLAFIVSFETGLALMALSINSITGWNTFIIMFLPRIVSIFAWSSALAYIEEFASREENGSKRFAISPFVNLVIWVSGLSIIGFPFTAGFISQSLLLTNLAQQDFNIYLGLVISLGLFGLGLIRFIYNLNKNAKYSNEFATSRTEKGFFITTLGILGLLGLFPQVLLNGMLVILQAFPNLK